MKNTVAVDQRFTLLAALGAHINWDSLTTEQVQVGIREAHTFAGAEATRFIMNGFRLDEAKAPTGETEAPIPEPTVLAIQIPSLPRPTLAELREKFPWIPEKNAIERDTSPTEAVTFTLGTVLRGNEKWIDGAEYERRRAPKLDVVLGYQQAVWLVEHKEEFPELMALLGKVYIDFPGLVVVGSGGYRHFPYLRRGGRRRRLRWHWVHDGFHSYGRFAVSSK